MEELQKTQRCLNFFDAENQFSPKIQKSILPTSFHLEIFFVSKCSFGKKSFSQFQNSDSPKTEKHANVFNYSFYSNTTFLKTTVFVSSIKVSIEHIHLGRVIHSKRKRITFPQMKVDSPNFPEFAVNSDLLRFPSAIILKIRAFVPSISVSTDCFLFVESLSLGNVSILFPALES